MESLDDAAAAIDTGGLVVYPTETVYGLGADALDAGAVDRVFAAKERPRSNPMALATHAVDEALAHVDPDPRTRAFMDAFLPGPVTVVCRRRSTVPDELTGGRDRVGVRVPDHDLARTLLDRTGPLTATSANPSGRDAVRSVGELSPAIREAANVIVDGGRTPGGASTVVDVERGVIHRRGRRADEVSDWLADRT